MDNMMIDTLTEPIFTLEKPDTSNLVTEDDEPVDNMFSAKQQRLLVEPLYSFWQSQQPFLADANVGLFNSVHEPPIVPDMFLSLDVQVNPDWFAKEHRSYFMWEFGKPPELVIEVVSNTKGGELHKKLQRYAQLGIQYYVVYDPHQFIQKNKLQVYELRANEYVAKPNQVLDKLNLQLTLWEGIFEQISAEWLRWGDADGHLIPTGAEQAQQERQRADRLAAQLKAMGIEPEA